MAARAEKQIEAVVRGGRICIYNAMSSAFRCIDSLGGEIVETVFGSDYRESASIAVVRSGFQFISSLAGFAVPFLVMIGKQSHVLIVYSIAIIPSAFVLVYGVNWAGIGGAVFAGGLSNSIILIVLSIWTGRLVGVRTFPAITRLSIKSVMKNRI